MDNTYFPALQWLVAERSIANVKDYEIAAKAIVAASRKFPMYYREFPSDEMQVLEKEIFQAEALATYLADKVGTNELSLYQQDVIRKLMQRRTLEWKDK